MQCILEQLEAEFPPGKSNVEVLVPKSNKGFASYDGIRVGGLRVVQEVSIRLGRLFLYCANKMASRFKITSPRGQRRKTEIASSLPN